MDDSAGVASTDMGDISEDIKTKARHETNLAAVPIDPESTDLDSCKEIIVECLLKHYDSLSIFGMKFTWLGVHKIYRVALVACKTFITEPVNRLYPMSTLVLAMTAANAIMRPCKDKRANTTATLSYIANLCIGGLNLVKAHLVVYGCDTSCVHRDTVIKYMGTIKNALLTYAPFTGV